MICVRKISIKYRYSTVDIILKLLEWFQKKDVRAWAFRDKFESTPTICYIYKKDLSTAIALKLTELCSSSQFLDEGPFIVSMPLGMSIAYADNRPYIISSQSQNIRPL